MLYTIFAIFLGNQLQISEKKLVFKNIDRSLFIDYTKFKFIK